MLASAAATPFSARSALLCSELGCLVFSIAACHALTNPSSRRRSSVGPLLRTGHAARPVWLDGLRFQYGETNLLMLSLPDCVSVPMCLLFAGEPAGEPGRRDISNHCHVRATA